MPAPAPLDPIELAERLLELLDEGRFTATYKYAVLLALIDLCLESSTTRALAPTTLTTRQMAERIVAIYWPQTRAYHARTLRQSGGGRDSQAEIVRAIERFRAAVGPEYDTSLELARRAKPRRWEQLIRTVEWKLIEMPLPRLQVVGDQHLPLLYEIGWSKHPEQRLVTRYQRGEPTVFDNRILLRPGVADALVRLNTLLRPLIQQQWTAKVAELNALDVHGLEDFLFGVSRTRLYRVRAPLCALQEDRCFYCRERLGHTADRTADVDHFIPWSRYPDDGIHNLVAAHTRCNQEKRAFLAAVPHLETWSRRNWGDDGGAAALRDIAAATAWEAHADQTRRVAGAMYLRLPGNARLWVRGQTFEAPDGGRIAAALGTIGGAEGSVGGAGPRRGA